MSTIRVPYPEDPETRQNLFDRAAAALMQFGSYEGTPEEGTFQGSTPIGEFAGSYRAIAGAAELHIVLIKKPWLVSTHMIEHEVRKLMSSS